MERFRKTVESASFSCASGELKVTVSLGGAEAMAGEDAAALLRRADAAMYASKAAGRNCGHWHDGRLCLAIGDRGDSVRNRLPRSPARPSRRGPPLRICSRNEFAVALGHRLAEWRRGGVPPAVVLVRIDDYAGPSRPSRAAGRRQGACRPRPEFPQPSCVREMDTSGPI